MLRLFLGVNLGALLVAGGLYVASRHMPCFDRCGDGTRCQENRCVALAPTGPRAAPPPVKPGAKRRHATRAGITAAPEATLRPGDDKMIAQGDALGRPEHVDLTAAGDDGRERSQDDFDAVVRPAQPAIERCITAALGDAPLDTGRVEVAFRVEKSGGVSRVRVEAPAILQRAGLYKCVRGVVAALRFTPAGGASVATYPFELK